MANDLPPLPPGFTLDGGPTKKNAAKLPPLPPGFAMDEQPANAGRKGSFLPLSRDAEGNLQFDLSAGITGDIGRATLSGFTAPGDVASGKLDPNSPEGMRRALDFAALATPVNPAIRAGDKAIPGVLKAFRPKKPLAPTVDALKEASEAGYEAVRTMGVDYSSAAVKSLADDIQRELQDKGILAELSPKTFSILGKLQNPPADSVAGIEGLVAARRAFNNAAGDFTNPTERLAANRVVDRLDEFLQGRDASSVVAGAGVGDGGAPAAAAAAARALEDARGNYAAAKRSERITGAEERAELNAAVANSGANVDNQLRARARDLLTRPKESRGYSKEEIEFLEKIARGTFSANFTRKLGNLLGGGGGHGAQVAGGIGAAFGGSFGGFPGASLGFALPPVIGALSKRASGALVRRQFNKLDEMIRKRSPLYQAALRNPPMAAASPEARAVLTRGLMLAAPGLMEQ